jgi:hypothetical protein
MMLPVSQKVHENMPAQHLRYLRAFYTLGGSLHDQPIELNQVRVICAMATRNCLPGRKATTDDHADAEEKMATPWLTDAGAGRRLRWSLDIVDRCSVQ